MRFKTVDQSTLIYHCLNTHIKNISRIYDSDMILNKNDPSHEKMSLMSYANNKGADQPAHPRSLISTFVVRCLDSIISLDSIAEISRL